MSLPYNTTTTDAVPGEAAAYALALSLLGSLALALSAQWPGIVSPFTVNDDVRQQLFWTQRWFEPGLYSKDLLGDYSRLYVSWGVQGLYWFGALFMNTLAFSKWVAIALLTSQGVLLFMLVRMMLGQATGLLALGLFWLMPCYLENISGGLARAFAAPLLTLFLYSLVSRRRWLALAALLGQALFIPYILPICLGTACLHFAAWRLGLERTAPLLRSLLDLLLAGLALGLAMAWQGQMGAADFGPLPWASEMVGRPEFGPQGRYPILPVPSLAWELVGRPLGSLAPFREIGPWAGAAILCTLVPLMGLGAWRLGRSGFRRLDPVLGYGLLASVFLYFMARVVLLKLFIPSRYLEYTANVLLCVVLALLLSEVLLPALRHRSRAFGSAFLALAFVLGAVRQHGLELYDYSEPRALYEAVRRLPLNACVAGDPELMDNVLTFGHRNVYITAELAHPWSQGYWSQASARLEGILKAYYASDPEEVRRYCARVGIDFLVVDKRHFTREYMTAKHLFEPYSTAMRKRADDPAPYALLLDSLPGSFVDDNVRIINLRKLQAGSPAAAESSF